MSDAVEQAIKALSDDYAKKRGDILPSDRKLKLHRLHNFAESNSGREGARLIQSIVLETIDESPGITNAEIARRLNIESHDNNGRNKDFFVFVIAKRLEGNRKIVRGENSGRTPPKGWWKV